MPNVDKYAVLLGGLVPPVIRMPLKNRKAAIELLQQDYARQLVRQSDLAEREDGLRLRTGRIAPAIGGATANRISWVPCDW